MTAPSGDGEQTVPAVVSSATLPDTVWRLRGDAAVAIRPQPVLRLSSLMLVRDAVLAGAGAALLPEMIVADDVAAGRLISWGPAEGGRSEI